ncbi:GPI mannosyltransferase 2 [Beauveria bassiana]|nr:GPI mannosyltransferase 2 [Beauveria bassiana]KAH8709408.1 GPI mannosyltransferase 2 [Beauveria bassiana]
MALKASSPNASRSPSSSSSPLLTLTLAFIAWKSFILLLSCGGALVGPDYDTSTSLFFARSSSSSSSSSSATLLARRLTRWDAIYFVHAARGGINGSRAPVYEQQWAFSPALSLFLQWLAAQARRTSSILGRLPLNDGRTEDDDLEALAGIALAHASHAVAVFTLHRLTLLLTGGDARRALLAALLCVVSPAGVFLSAPYAESPFAALSFAGVWVLAAGYEDPLGSARRSAAVLAAGAVLGLATAVRSNGLANGLLFAVEALRAAGAFVKAPGVRLAVAAGVAGVGGVLVAMGSAIPQYVAYTIYCGGGGEGRAAVMRPPWCERTVPSIYSYVQDVYWNVGFLRYWTPNQIPLFLLAAPVLTLLIASGYEVLRRPAAGGFALSSLDHRVLVQALAASQAIVALLALTSYHVQVISRLASGYAVWYWWIAACLMDKSRRGVGRAAVIFMVMYGGIQAVLFSTFLPPA